MILWLLTHHYIVALRNEKGSYNHPTVRWPVENIVALRNEKGSYNLNPYKEKDNVIVALRNEKGSYNPKW